MAKPHIILPYSILIGLTPLIPVPYLDDWVASLLVRRMVTELANAHGLKLTPAEVAQLSAGEAAGLLGGCLSSLLVYPLLKRILREIIFVLEWQRAINYVSHSYYYAYLLDTAFENGWYAPRGLSAARSLARAAQVNAAIHRVRKGANTNLVRRVVETRFNNSKNAVLWMARWLYTQLRKISFQRAGQSIQGGWVKFWRKKPKKTKAPPKEAPVPVSAPPLAAEEPPEQETSRIDQPQEPGAQAPAPKRPGLRAWFSPRRKKKTPRPAPPAPRPPPKKARPLDEVLHMDILWLRLGELSEKIQEDLTSLPRDHFDGLKRRLAEELARQDPARQAPTPPNDEDTVPTKVR